jgi:hypothetical protein
MCGTRFEALCAHAHEGRCRAECELVVRRSPHIQLIVHPMPRRNAERITITSPPERRENTALKFLFKVPRLAHAEATAIALGGEVYKQQWEGPGFRARNACIPKECSPALASLTANISAIV